jgi:ubiquinone/menaquinone biosynthesis C-methylase UbiE
MSRTASRTYRAIAEYYDAEYESADMLQRDVPFFLEQLARRSRRRLRILDLATGTGRSAIPPAQAGHRVVGVDRDAAMLAIARRKRDAVGLTERNLRLVRADIARLDLPGESFDCATVFFNTLLVFTTLAEQDRVLAGVRRHLRPRGRLWIDIYNPDPALLGQDVREDIDPELFYVPSLGRTVHRTTEVRQLDAPQLQRIIHHYRWFDDAQGERHERVEFDLTYLFPRELQILLERHGFGIEQAWGDYNADPLTRHSPRIIVLARARARARAGAAREAGGPAG